MPAEDPSLDERLDAARHDVLGRIEQPPLGALHARARAHRNRRRGAVTAVVATLAVLTGGAVALGPRLGGDTGRGTPIAAVPASTGPSPAVSVASGDGITLTGLEDRAAVTDLPGRIGQVTFVDRRTGYVLNDCHAQPDCTRTIARTTDGGRHWETSPVDTQLEITELNAFAGGTVVLSTATESLVSPDSGRSWRHVPNEGASTDALPDGDVMCRRAQQNGAFKTAALSTGGRTVALATQPDLDVHWVAPAATDSRAWWVAGADDSGHAAVAVTRDAGQSWTLTSFRVGGVDGVTVATRDTQVYVIVTGANGALRAIYHSADDGGSFQPTRAPNATGAPTSVAGEAVPLPDGRLLIAGDGATWWVSPDRGASFTEVKGSLPAVGELRRTTAGWIADDLYGAGYVAFSPDGVSWQKLWIN